MSRLLSIVPATLAVVVLIEGVMLADARARLLTLEGKETAATAATQPLARQRNSEDDSEANPGPEDFGAVRSAVRGRLEAADSLRAITEGVSSNASGAGAVVLPPPEQMQRLVRAEMQRLTG